LLDLFIAQTWTSLVCRSASISFTLVNRGYE
jgi:hypothetical protein